MDFSAYFLLLVNNAVKKRFIQSGYRVKSMKKLVHLFCIFITITVIVLAAGCTETEEGSPAGSSSASPADELYAGALEEMKNANYRTASSMFEEAYTLYKDSGDDEGALAAIKGMMRAEMSTFEFPFNKTGAVSDMNKKIPGITEEEIEDWLQNSAQKIESDGETLYFTDISANYLYKNFELLRDKKTIDFDYVKRYAIRDEDVSSGDGETRHYTNPEYYTGYEKIEIPKDALPKKGLLKIWMPLPVETDSQTNITVEGLTCPEYIANGPVTTGGIGYVYYEIPAGEIEGDLVIKADIGFTAYEQVFDVDPERVLPYDKSVPEYVLYTRSERNIEITDEIRNKAKEIAGDETNPCLQAQKIYNYIITTYAYSHVPHVHLDVVVPKTAESTHMFKTGHGDCGTQSMLFSALCRSLGIPARASGGYQMLLAEKPGTHFWAEYYIEGYGWIPCDTTVAEAADWVYTSDEDREIFKKYYSSSLDPARYVIQKNVDVEMKPDIPGDDVAFRLVRQTPAIITDSPEYAPGLLFEDYFTLDLRKTG